MLDTTDIVLQDSLMYCAHCRIEFNVVLYGQHYFLFTVNLKISDHYKKIEISVRFKDFIEHLAML